MPLRKDGYEYYLSSFAGDGWISGIGFSKNLWKHVYNSAQSYINRYNNNNMNATTAIRYGSDGLWIND